MQAQIRDQVRARDQRRIHRERVRQAQDREEGFQAAFEGLRFLFPIMAVPPGAPLADIPIRIGAGDVHDRPVNVVPLPIFRGDYNEDPDLHVAEFLVSSIANNARTPEHWLAIFPATLKGAAFQWYERQANARFNDWDDLKQEFLTHFRREGFIDRMRDEFMNLKQVEGEKVESYVSRMESILKRWGDHHLDEGLQKGAFICGLQPDLRKHVELQRPACYPIPHKGTLTQGCYPFPHKGTLTQILMLVFPQCFSSHFKTHMQQLGHPLGINLNHNLL